MVERSTAIDRYECDLYFYCTKEESNRKVQYCVQDKQLQTSGQTFSVGETLHQMTTGFQPY